ncbi:MAG TPA: sigma-70 family RNA polymerase sigma factor [Acidimicrobiales bacterium]|nr:sigma-70 family RNA polymerase sigma factor [Acidimicrobiales bacterium]
MRQSRTSSQFDRAGPAIDPVRAYLDDVGRHDLLTRQDEERLARSIESGRNATEELKKDGSLPPERRRHLLALVAECERSTREFIVSNLRLVVSIAKRYRNSGIPMSDLIQEGNIGLIQAVRKFDHRRGFRFSTYATFWIRQAIGRAVHGSGRTIRLPVEVGERLAALRRAQSRLESRLGRPPTVAEVAGEVGLPPAKVAGLLDHATHPVSLDATLGEDGSELGELVEDHHATKPFEDAVSRMTPSAVDRLLAALDGRDREVLCLRYGLSGEQPMSFHQVGQRLGVTGERARQLERRALSRLRPELKRLEEQGLLDR